METKKTIAIFSAQYLPHMGGVEFFTREISERLVKAGHRVVVITSEQAGSPEYEFVQCGDTGGEGVEVYRLPSFALLGGRFPFPRFGKHRVDVLSELERISFDGVIVNTRFYPHSITGARFGSRQHVPTIVLDHGSDYVTFGVRALDPVVRAYERFVTTLLKMHSPDFYGISGMSAEWLKSLGVNPKGVIPNAIDANAFRSLSSGRSFREELSVSDGSLVVAYVGRFVPEKGILGIVGAAELLKKADAPVRFVLAGEGPLESVCRKAPDNVSVVGRLSQADVSALLSESDVFVFPSRSEGFGMSLLEAAACGNALMSTPVGIAPDLVSARAGLTLSTPSAHEIAERIAELEGDRERVRLMGECAMAAADGLFTWDGTIRSLGRALGEG
ncbi:glycosyltransferase family 4 protein [Parvibacter caecicola]|uniref:glycosyltransferase family 4 protein n=1 Tax=Parvibacter caecicola TaxID=747645 RepID=UPI00272FE82E|nr:glycosyltransferase family 4 protein [Parvibacter caecicola]